MKEKLCYGPLCKGNVEKSFSQFEPDSASPDGLGDICEACRTYIQLQNELKNQQEEPMEEKRTCKQCGTAKPLDQFYPTYPNKCKACVLAHQKAMKKMKAKAAGASVAPGKLSKRQPKPVATKAEGLVPISAPPPVKDTLVLEVMITAGVVSREKVEMARQLVAALM